MRNENPFSLNRRQMSAAMLASAATVPAAEALAAVGPADYSAWPGGSNAWTVLRGMAKRAAYIPSFGSSRPDGSKSRPGPVQVFYDPIGGSLGGAGTRWASRKKDVPAYPHALDVGRKIGIRVGTQIPFSFLKVTAAMNMGGANTVVVPVDANGNEVMAHEDVFARVVLQRRGVYTAAECAKLFYTIYGADAGTIKQGVGFTGTGSGLIRGVHLHNVPRIAFAPRGGAWEIEDSYITDWGSAPLNGSNNFSGCLLHMESAGPGHTLRRVLAVGKKGGDTLWGSASGAYGFKLLDSVIVADTNPRWYNGEHRDGLQLGRSPGNTIISRSALIQANPYNPMASDSSGSREPIGAGLICDGSAPHSGSGGRPRIVDSIIGSTVTGVNTVNTAWDMTRSIIGVQRLKSGAGPSKISVLCTMITPWTMNNSGIVLLDGHTNDMLMTGKAPIISGGNYSYKGNA